MRTLDVIIVRIYLTEGEGQLNRIIDLLKEKEEVRGVTVFRGIAGFGPSGSFHTSSWSDLSLDLPLVLEMFDEPGKIQHVLKHLAEIIKPGHILTWPGQINIDGKN